MQRSIGPDGWPLSIQGRRMIKSSWFSQSNAPQSVSYRSYKQRFPSPQTQCELRFGFDDGNLAQISCVPGVAATTATHPNPHQKRKNVAKWGRYLATFVSFVGSDLWRVPEGTANRSPIVIAWNIDRRTSYRRNQCSTLANKKPPPTISDLPLWHWLVGV